ncbi:MAG: ABC transporter ATP-binding protein [Oscillospiraceae bacterium]|nr:ABC transporter ATP-binding protein [Oscillospiraceae bacterium]
MNNMILSINGLAKSYKDFTLKDASFEIEQGTVMGLIGQNGAGKTTIIRLIMNMINRDGGTVKVCGLDNINDEIAVKNKIGYVSDESFFFYNTNLARTAKACSYAYDNWDADKFADFLKKWELPEKKKIAALSKGMQTKAMLAVALSHNPELLILDEPTAGLDPVARIEILDLLRDFVSDGKRSVLFSTHITGDLDKIADVITLIIDGQIRESMSIDAIEDRYAVISGASSKLTSENEKYTIGLRELNTGFESLILRENLSKFDGVSVKNPNVENLLTFSIWQNRKESSK